MDWTWQARRPYGCPRNVSVIYQQQWLLPRRATLCHECHPIPIHETRAQQACLYCTRCEQNCDPEGVKLYTLAMSLAQADVQDDTSIFQQSSPESLRPQARALSPRSETAHHHQDYEDSTSAVETTTDEDENYNRPLSQRPSLYHCSSSRSSISSFPASVIHTVQHTDFEDNHSRPHTPSRSQTRTPQNAFRSPPLRSEYLSGFRNPSSVRALQLESEYADSSDNMSVRYSPRAYSHRKIKPGSPGSGSIHSSPTRRGSRPGTPRVQSGAGGGGSKLKKEFPLVLLHCSLLSPAVTSRTPPVSDEILEAVLPEEYRKRWKLLQDKVAKNSEVKQRGVLISHPREEYELLEERLLESLELERPRIRRGHYLGRDGNRGSDSGFESEGKESLEGEVEIEETGQDRQTELGERCPECDKAVSCSVEQVRKWEIKVFAANGLMKSGAWAAAWQEMEKVDVEVSVWMPEDVRVEVEERLHVLQAKEEAERPVPTNDPVVTPKKGRRKRSNTAKLRHDERMREIYGETTKVKSQDEIDGLADESIAKKTSTVHAVPTSPKASAHAEESFSIFIHRHLRLLWHDQKNFAIILLSALVLFFSLQNAKRERQGAAQPTTVPLSGVSEVLSSPTHTPTLSYITTTVLAAPSTTISQGDVLSGPLPEESVQLVPSGTNTEHDEAASQMSEASFDAEEEEMFFNGDLGDNGPADVILEMQVVDEDQVAAEITTGADEVPLNNDMSSNDTLPEETPEIANRDLEKLGNGDFQSSKMFSQEVFEDSSSIHDAFEAVELTGEGMG